MMLSSGGSRSLSGVEGIAQELGGMPRAPTREMLDLLTARYAGRDHLRIRRRGLHGGGEAPASQRHRDVVVLLLEAEGARHAAAAGVHLVHLVARPGQGGHRGRRADHGLLVAVAVEQGAAWARLEAELESPGSLAQEKLLEEEA